MPKKKLLVVTSGYERWLNDAQYKSDFIVKLTKKLSEYFEVVVLAPIDKGAQPVETIDGIKIYRHKQYFTANLGIAYGSGIIPNIKKNKKLALLIPFYLLYQFIDLVKIVRSEKIDIIQAHWIIPQGFIAILYKLLFNRKINVQVAILGSDINSFDNFIGKALIRFTVKFSDGISTVSNFSQGQIASMGYNKEIAICPMGVDSSVFNPDKRAEEIRNKLKVKKDLIVFVGRIVEDKGIRYLIQAIPDIIKSCPETKLAVIGSGNLLDEMKALTERLKISENVVFLGRVSDEDLPYYFACSDIFILPSFNEGFPLVVEEALSSGTICVVSDIPVFKDFNQTSDLLVLIEKMNSKDIAQKVLDIIHNKNKYEGLRQKGRDYAVNNLDWNIIALKYNELLNRIFKNDVLK